MNHAVTVGDLVVASYKTGQYLAEVVEEHHDRLLIKVLAVHKHPDQGDLHRPLAVDIPLFHQRRALAYQEKVYVPRSHATPWQGLVPSYEDSLRQALDEQIRLMTQTVKWAERSLAELEQLKRDYFPS